MNYPYLQGKIALITGGSRGIGASTALTLAANGTNLVLNYRNKAGRAEEVADKARSQGVSAVTIAADLTSESDVEAMMRTIHDRFGRLDIVVLNASGGLERDLVARNPDYPMLLNRDAQLWTMKAALPLMPRGGRVVFVTSHWAHFYGHEAQEAIEEYEPVASSKHAGEQALMSRLPELEERGIRLVRVSGDMVEGTITPKLLEHIRPGTLDARRPRIWPPLSCRRAVMTHWRMARFCSLERLT
jgi:NAD(P)-dependent dehydrogenase (short-subunit alcohol dehydrogenase family)